MLSSVSICFLNSLLGQQNEILQILFNGFGNHDVHALTYAFHGNVKVCIIRCKCNVNVSLRKDGLGDAGMTQVRIYIGGHDADATTEFFVDGWYQSLWLIFV